MFYFRLQLFILWLWSPAETLIISAQYKKKMLQKKYWDYQTPAHPDTQQRLVAQPMLSIHGN